eukprot:COSAG02_NODE_67351_length_253_cov_0.668831_1_plen_31_part_01
MHVPPDTLRLNIVPSGQGKQSLMVVLKRDVV